MYVGHQSSAVGVRDRDTQWMDKQRDYLTLGDNSPLQNKYKHWNDGKCLSSLYDSALSIDELITQSLDDV